MSTEEIDFLQQSNWIEGEMSSQALDDAVAAWEYIKTADKLTLPVILKAHRLLMGRLNPRIAGKLRKVYVRVGWSLCPDPGSVRRLLMQWLSTERHLTDETIKKKHVSFEKIHPFEDGNGRVGRIIMNWQRLRAGLPVLVIHEGEEQYEYYKWFR